MWEVNIGGSINEKEQYTCLKILEYSDGRYIDDLLKAIKKSKLIK